MANQLVRAEVLSLSVCVDSVVTTLDEEEHRLYLQNVWISRFGIAVKKVSRDRRSRDFIAFFNLIQTEMKFPCSMLFYALRF